MCTPQARVVPWQKKTLPLHSLLITFSMSLDRWVSNWVKKEHHLLVLEPHRSLVTFVLLYATLWNLYRIVNGMQTPSQINCVMISFIHCRSWSWTVLTKQKHFCFAFFNDFCFLFFTLCCVVFWISVDSIDMSVSSLQSPSSPDFPSFDSSLLSLSLSLSPFLSLSIYALKISFLLSVWILTISFYMRSWMFIDVLHSIRGRQNHLFSWARRERVKSKSPLTRLKNWLI